jgi:ribosomal protein S18 acetylase RimI-like enzyme
MSDPARVTYTRIVNLAHGRRLVIRPLRNGDVQTVLDVFERLGERSRRARFNGAKPRLRDDELAHLAAIDATRHALVGYLPGDPRPIALARIVRDGASAEIAFEVVDEHQGRGIGSVLTAELVGDARAAGVREITALVAADNGAALALLRRILDRLEVRFDGPELEVHAALA